MASAPLKVAVGKGVAVGVGCGINICVPGNNVQAAPKLLIRTILFTETSKRAAIARHVSPSATVYERGVGLG